MNFSFNVFSAILLFSGAFTLLIALLLHQKLEKGIKPFSYIMIAISLWAIAYSVQLSIRDYSQIIFCTYLQYIGIVATPALWQIAVIRFIGKEKWLIRRNILLIFLIPSATLVLLYTNGFHHLYYTATSLARYGTLTFLKVEKGPWYVVHTVYFYVMLVWGLYLLIWEFNNSDSIYRRQRNIIVIATLAPWLFNIFYQLGLKPYKYLDLTPYSFILTSILVSYGFFRFKLFNISPIAKEKVFDAMQQGALVLDRQYRVVGLNQEIKKVLDVDSDIIGSHVNALFAGQVELLHLLVRESNSNVEFSLVQGGQERIFSVEATSLYENEIFTGKIVLFKDVTEFYAGERIRRLMQRKDDFLSIASHELKTPLTTLKGYLKLAEGIAEKEDLLKCADCIRKAARQGDKLTGLINDLLDVSKIEAGRMQYHFAKFALKDVLEDCVDFANNNSPSHSVQMQGDLDLIITGDRNRIEQVVCNLVSNAIKYSPDSKVVTIKVQKQGDCCVISVEDKGIGIPAEKQMKLFEKFYRVEETEQQYSGLGIGLFIAHEIIERHNGRLWVESKEGEGSTFSFSIPLDAR